VSVFNAGRPAVNELNGTSKVSRSACVLLVVDQLAVAAMLLIATDQENPEPSVALFDSQTTIP
jgi:hypothetical protein